jgi:hypothetical protein
VHPEALGERLPDRESEIDGTPAEHAANLGVGRANGSQARDVPASKTSTYLLISLLFASVAHGSLLRVTGRISNEPPLTDAPA